MPTDTKPPGWLLPIPCDQLARAEDNLNVLARLARQVWAVQDSDPDIFEAARETYQQAASRLFHSPDGQSALTLAGWIVGRITQVAGRDIATTTTEASTS